MGRIIVTLCLGLTMMYSFIGCQTTYYMVWEKLGKEKRHLLKSNLEKVQEEQQDASEQFQTVLDRIKEMYGFEGGELESFYSRLSSDYNECEKRAETVRERIENVEQIADDLFSEWEDEIALISNEKLKNDSKQSLDQTRRRYDQMHRAMAKAEKSMVPVLGNLRDYVLYLKHNLNAQAISSLKKEMQDIEEQVQVLIDDINRSIAEADQFIKKIES